MEHDKMSSLIVNESGNLIYLSDLETYELLYANKAILKQMNCPDDEKFYVGRKCYEVLQGFDHPCEFCTNSKLTQDEFYSWEIYNEHFDEYYTLRDKLVPMNGKLVRLEIANNVTKNERENNRLKSRLSIEETLVRCVQTLNDSDNIQAAIESLLRILSDYYDGERGYIFEFELDNDRLNNTYEWCRDGVTPQIDNLQKVPLESVDRWIDQFERTGEFFITSLGRNVEKGTLEYEILKQQEIESLIAAPLVRDGVIVGFIGVDNPKNNLDNLSLLTSVTCFVLEDIQKRRLMGQLKEMSFMDMLTGVKNRNHYLKTLDEIEDNKPESLGIIYMDMNGLKVINDTYGHSYGDLLIKEIARLLECVFPGSVYRIGGDEFVGLCRDLKEDEFQKRVTKIRELVSEDGRIHVSIGASWGSGNLQINEQINYADGLMYAEKQAYYKNMKGGQYNQRSRTAKELIHSIEGGDFVVYLQPKVDLKTNEVAGAEALVRRKDGKGGLILPGSFIPLYEAEGIIRHVDLYVLEIVCQTLAQWEEAHGAIPRISVNFSRITLLEYGIVDIICSICQKFGVDPEYIGIEVTESVSKIQPEQLESLMEEISGAGFAISLDDFGSQYSNLSILTNLGFDELKLDRSLVGDLAENEKSKVVVEHAIDMCRDLKVKSSVAEGIETKEQADFLRSSNCDLGQGFYFAKPMPIGEFYQRYVKK